MTEFVLALPVLAAVLAFLIFIGWSMQRKQRVVVASRYAVWRHFDAVGDDGRTLNDKLLNGAATSVDVYGDAGPAEALDSWADSAAGVDAGGGALADELLHRRWPQGWQARLQARYRPLLPIGRHFSDDMAFRHGRDGPEWVRGQANEWDTLTDLYYPDLEEFLTGIGPPADGWAGLIRGMYHAHW
jgi:hypothetical protein